MNIDGSWVMGLHNRYHHPYPLIMVLCNMCYTTGHIDIQDKAEEPKRLPQYAAAITANLMGFACGTIIAWTSPAGPHLINDSSGFPVTPAQLSLIGSLMPIGSALASVPTGYFTDRFGRKRTLLSLVPVALIGWSLIIWPRNVEMIYVGRLITGLCVGASCVACPVFTAEISHKSIRGELVSYFQLMLSIGILFTFLVGSELSVFHLSIACAMVPILFGIFAVFFPETPVYYVTRGRLDDAAESLKFYRGPSYDAKAEIRELEDSTNQKTDTEASCWSVFVSKQGLRSFFISCVLMAFQQLCGINASTFYTTTIFQAAGSSLEPKYATVVVGFMQLAGTVVAMFLIDRLGRVVLLEISAAAMCISMFFMGLYFRVKGSEFDTTNFSWLPLASLCVFTVAFAIGIGPIPWALMPEIIPSRIVGTVSSIGCVFNWMCAFLVTKFFYDLVYAVGEDVTFWLFSCVSLFGAVYIYLVIPETKGKSFEEIQKVMSH